MRIRSSAVRYRGVIVLVTFVYMISRIPRVFSYLMLWTQQARQLQSERNQIAQASINVKISESCLRDKVFKIKKKTFLEVLGMHESKSPECKTGTLEHY